MPPIGTKLSRSQRVTEKSEIGDLFQAIYKHYDPFQSRFLPFPLSVIAQARVWRRHPVPQEEALAQSLKALTEKGFVEVQVELLIAYCESAIRSIKAAELEMEELLPDMLYTKSATWAPNSAGFVLLETEFFNQLNVFEEKVGRKWVLAVGAVPLSIHGRPPLIAPWVVGVTMKRWLTIKSISDRESEALALDLASVLLGRPIRPEELRHWESLLNKVEVALDNNSKALLPAFLVSISTRIQPNDLGWGATAGTTRNPKDYLKTVFLDEDACKEVAKAIQKGWRPQKKPKTRRTAKQQDGTPLEAAIEPEVIIRALCNLCNNSILLQDIYTHFERNHNISSDQIEADATRKELRRAGTKQVLMRYTDA